jgi:hypothetical protein
MEDEKPYTAQDTLKEVAVNLILTIIRFETILDALKEKGALSDEEFRRSHIKITKPENLRLLLEKYYPFRKDFVDELMKSYLELTNLEG